MTTVKPVTAQELTQSEIEYSMKVGKQVITQQLKAEIEALESKLAESQKAIRKLIDPDKAEHDLRMELKLAIKSCDNTTALRRAINQFTGMSLSDNWDLVSNDCCASAARYLAAHRHNYCPVALSTYQSWVDSGEIAVDYRMHVAIRHERDFATDDPDDNISSEYEIKVKIPKAILKQMKAVLAFLQEWCELSDKVSIASNKLRNMDATMEEMEARLLVQELTRSERGKEVLKAASGIISEVLGTTPPLLEGTRHD